MRTEVDLLGVLYRERSNRSSVTNSSSTLASNVRVSIFEDLFLSKMRQRRLHSYYIKFPYTKEQFPHKRESFIKTVPPFPINKKAFSALVKGR